MSISRIALALLALVALAEPARADIQTSGPEVYPGKNEFSLHLGFQTGLTDYNFGGGPPAGFRVLGDYNFRFYDAGAFTVWLNAGLGLTVGGGCSATNPVKFANQYGCSGFATGDELQPMAGVKLKFRTPIPLVPYARFDAFFSYIFNRYCGDYGLAFGGRAAGGAKYFLTKNIGVGLETGFALGPAFYPHGAPASDPACFDNNYTYPGHTEFYATFDFLLGAEFAF